MIGEKEAMPGGVRAVAGLGLAPAEVFARVAARRGAFFFDTTVGGKRRGGEVSLVGCEPEGELAGNLENPGELRQWLAAHATGNPEGVNYPLGGAFGRVSYEGDFRFGLYRNFLVYRHGPGDWMEVGSARHWLEGPERVARGAKLRFEPRSERAWFETAVRRAQEYIAAGDIYQVNLAQGFTARWPEGGEPGDFFQVLRTVSPAPYAAYLAGSEGVLLSASPELFLRFSGRTVETRPIKGTRPRYADAERDRQSARELLRSEKERAELVMITDLERNDLGQFCEYGSVEVRDLAELEQFEQVYHLVSTVRGRMRAEIDAVEALRLAFPGGSVTGAPKKRAMEIIRELEGSERGSYTGAIGYFGLNGESQFSIAIRTAELREGRVEFRVGAGIVADSEPGLEYEETLHKAAGMLQAAEIWGGMEERFALPGDFRRIAGEDGPSTAIVCRLV